MNLSKYRRSLDGTDVVLGARRIRGPQRIHGTRSSFPRR